MNTQFKKILLCLLAITFFSCEKNDDNSPKEPTNNQDQENVSENYVAIDFAKTKLTQWNNATGEATLTFTDKVPAFVKGESLVVIENETEGQIRRVTNFSINGLNVTLQTEQAYLNEIFSNTELIFSTDPEMAKNKSAGSRIYTPVKIICDYGDKVEVVYDENIPLTKSSGAASFGISYNSSGIIPNIIPNTTLKHSEAISVNADIAIKLGENASLLHPISSIESASFCIAGIATVGRSITGTYSSPLPINKKIPMREKPQKYRFRFMVGYVPIWIDVEVKYFIEFSAEIKGQASLELGADATLNLEGGVIYKKESSLTPIKKADFSFKVRQPVLEISNDVEAKVTVYPEYKFFIYNAVGPVITIQPYAKGTARVGTKNEETFYSFTLSSGLDMTAEFQLNNLFKSDDQKLYTIQPNPLPIFETVIYEAPKKVEIVDDKSSVEAEKPMMKGDKKKIKLEVKDNDIAENVQKKSKSKIKIEYLTKSSRKESEPKYIETDKNGDAEIEWELDVPDKDAHFVARLLNESLEEIHSTEYQPITRIKCGVIDYSLEDGDMRYTFDNYGDSERIDLWPRDGGHGFYIYHKGDANTFISGYNGERYVSSSQPGRMILTFYTQDDFVNMETYEDEELQENGIYPAEKINIAGKACNQFRLPDQGSIAHWMYIIMGLFTSEGDIVATSAKIPDELPKNTFDHNNTSITRSSINNNSVDFNSIEKLYQKIEKLFK